MYKQIDRNAVVPKFSKNTLLIDVVEVPLK